MVTGKSAKNVTSFSSVHNVVRFLNNYAEQHAIILPGRVSTVYNANVQLQPSSDIKIKVHEIYKNSFTNKMPAKPVSTKVFTNIWRHCCPEIVVMKPRSELCALCKKVLHIWSQTGISIGG